MTDYNPQFKPAPRESIAEIQQRKKDTEGPANKVAGGIVAYLLGTVFFAFYLNSIDVSGYSSDSEPILMVIAAGLYIVGTIYFLWGLHTILVNVVTAALKISRSRNL